MGDRQDRLVDLAALVADGSAIDWTEAESLAATESERQQIKRLRAVREVSDAQVSMSFERPSGAHDSLLHPPTADQSLDAEPQPVTWGPLTVVEKIGRGQFGDVYRARDPRLDRDVALKLLRRRAAETDGLGSSIIEEGRLLARIRHANVVTVYGAERVDGRVGLWMELVRGRTLEDEMAIRGPFAADDVTAIGVGLCQALSAVHRAGLVHRDVTARNVMRDSDDRLVLMDFGTGQELDAGSSAELAGTPLYMAPEVLAGGPATPQSDLYSAGIVLHHLATGTFPVKGRTIKDVREAHAACAMTLDAPGREYDALFAVIRRAVAPKARVRFASAADMGTELAAIGRAAPRRKPWPIPPVLAVLAVVAGVGAVWISGVRSAPTSRATIAAPAASPAAVAIAPVDPSTVVPHAGGPCTPAPGGLIAWWTGDRSAADETRVHDGAISGGVQFVPGVVGQAFGFDGRGARIVVPDSPALRPKHITIEAWVRFDTLDTAGPLPGLEYIAFKKNTRGPNFEAFTLHKERYLEVERLAFRVVDKLARGNIAFSTTEVARGRVYHVAATFDGAFVRLFVDGVLEAQSAAAVTLDYSTRPVSIGGTGEKWEGPLNGIIDELTIYSRALQPSEVARIHAAGAAGKCRLTGSRK